MLVCEHDVATTVSTITDDPDWGHDFPNLEEGAMFVTSQQESAVTACCNI